MMALQRRAALPRINSLDKRARHPLHLGHDLASAPILFPAVARWRPIASVATPSTRLSFIALLRARPQAARVSLPGKFAPMHTPATRISSTAIARVIARAAVAARALPRLLLSLPIGCLA